MILGIDASQANRKIRSGTEWYAFHLIEEFKKLLAGRSDITIRLYTKDLLQQDLAMNLPDNFSARGGPASGWEVKILRWPFPYFWVQGRLSWEMLTNPPDILFCPAHTIPLIHPGLELPLPLPARSAGGFGKEGRWRGVRGKTFTTLHDVGFEDYPELYDKLSLWYHRFSAKLAVKKADHIFTISEFSRERIMEVYGCPGEKITVTYLGCNPSRPAGTLPSPGEGNKEHILFVGRIEPKKNIANIIKGYEMADVDIPFYLAGSIITPPKISAQGGPASGWKFLGYIKEEDKRALYQNAAVFLFPTLYEGFGLPILEAQAAGVPVITSNTASNPEIAGDGALIVSPESPYEIAEAIKKLLDDKNLREDLVKKGYENVKRFSWEETAKATLSKIMSS